MTYKKSSEILWGEIIENRQCLMLPKMNFSLHYVVLCSCFNDLSVHNYDDIVCAKIVMKHGNCDELRRFIFIIQSSNVNTLS